MPIDDTAFPHLDRTKGLSKREYATLIVAQGMIAKHGMPTANETETFVEAASALAEAIVRATERG